MDWTRGYTVGRGSTATVSVAMSRQSGEVFAVKTVDLAQSDMLRREQRILSDLTSARIVGYKGYEITEDNDKLVHNLMMEYVPGGNLADVIRRHGGRLDESVIAEYMRQIVEGLEYLHSSGVVHCDIKGKNILIGDAGAKIADFGCAKWTKSAKGSTDREKIIGGTPMYMAPEVARGEEQGFPADIWALGCTMIEMATGSSPWPGIANPVAALYRIGFSGELPELPYFLSDEARHFLSKCLRRDPKERWTVEQLVKHPFLVELNSNGKQSQDSGTGSPTSILDQRFWNSVEELECLSESTRTSSSDWPRQRIGQLSLNSGMSEWRCDDGSWITVRCNENESRRSNSSDIVMCNLNFEKYLINNIHFS